MQKTIKNRKGIKQGRIVIIIGTPGIGKSQPHPYLRENPV